MQKSGAWFLMTSLLLPLASIKSPLLVEDVPTCASRSNVHNMIERIKAPYRKKQQPHGDGTGMEQRAWLCSTKQSRDFSLFFFYLV